MESCDALLAALDNFPGAVVMVTHNELFLHALAARMIVFQDEGIQTYEGGYQDFLDEIGWPDEPRPTATLPHPEDKRPQPEKVNRKEVRRRRSEIISERSRVLRPCEEKIAAVEAEIERQEGLLKTLTAEMQRASEAREADRIAEIGRSLHACQATIERLFAELETLSESCEAHKRKYEKALSALDAQLKEAE
jgi:ATP-binding cassette subfamily F protein 3